MSDEQRDHGRHASTTDGEAPIDQPASGVPEAAAGSSSVGGTSQGDVSPPRPGHLSPGPAAPPAAGPARPDASPQPAHSEPPTAAQTNPTAAMSEARPPRRSRVMTGIVATALIAGVIGGGTGFGGYALLEHASTTAQLNSHAATAIPTVAVRGSVTAAAATAMPSTVDIRVNLAQGTAEGSGVILTSDGNMLTNNHVVAGATGPITVTLADGSTHQATVVGTAPSYDLAVIKIGGVSGLTPAVLGHSANLQVGQQVVAIGSPQGLTGTVTQGIISAFNRTVTVAGSNGATVVYNGLQTDAPINPGNSGGPLVNLAGQVIGINSAIATAGGQGGGSVGLGFAIPVDQAHRVAQEILATGVATKPVLGVRGSATAAGSAGAAARSAGAAIASVAAGSPAAAAGLVAGDVVTKVGSATVADFADLAARIGSYPPGSPVTLTVTDPNGGAPRSVSVTLGSTPDQAATTSGGGSSTTPSGGRSPVAPNPSTSGP